ncbi:MAG: hypothetical protein ABH845_01065 [Candidatus Omnitrophota bacterium]
MNQNHTKATLYLQKKRDGFFPFRWPTLFLIVVSLLTKQKGMLVHATGIRFCGRGFLFVGASGSGKSTLAKLFEKRKDAVVLNDDRIVLRKRGPGFYIFGTPWHSRCKSFSPESVPLSAIFFLSHGRKNILTPVGPKEAVARLLREIPLIVPETRLSASSLVLELCERIPAYTLAFSPTKKVVPFLKKRRGKNGKLKSYP